MIKASEQARRGRAAQGWHRRSLLAIALLPWLAACGDGGTGADLSTITLASNSPPASALASTPAPTPSPAPTPAPTPIPTPTPASTPSAATGPQALACTVADAVRRATSLVIAKPSGGITVVAVGSSSTAGYLASSPAAAYPAVMQELLAAHPEVAAYVVYNKGQNGDNIIATQARLQRDVLDLKPQLVILQAGTNDATQGPNDTALADYTSRLRAVVAQLKQNAPVVLMNSQHVPGENSYFYAYQTAMEIVSAEQNVPIFDRYALMKSWIDSGKYQYSDILASDSFHPNDFTYRCMAQVMAELTLARTARN